MDYIELQALLSGAPSIDEFLADITRDTSVPLNFQAQLLTWKYLEYIPHLRSPNTQRMIRNHFKGLIT